MDDFTASALDPDPEVIAAALNKDLVKIAKWAKCKRFKIRAEKLQVIFLSPWNREKVFPQIFYEGSPIPVTKQIKILGLTYDSLHTLTPHVDIAKSKGLSRVPIIKAVMGSDWGFCLEDGVLTYKALIQPVLGFGAPVWYPLQTSLKHPVAPLQVVQNACLCAIMGCHTSTSVQHLHDESRMLQVQDQLDIQCSQFLLNTRQVDHPSHSITSRPPGPRPSRKSTLQHQFSKNIEQFVNANNKISSFDYKKATKQIHTNAVASALEKREVNPVLGTPPPEVHPSEATLPRAV
jgi:hypothetical protein